MLIILPVIFWLAVFFIFIKYSENEVILTNIREAFIWATITFGVSTIFIIEGLSYFHAITTFYLAAAWLIALLIAVSIWFNRRRSNEKLSVPKVSLSIMDKVLLGLIIFIVGATALTAVIAPPNNYDAMTYHLARIKHWQQNQSVAHYPTYILRQLYYQPGAEYHILNFMVLSGGDLLANIVQWLSMLGSLLLISLIAKELGADRKGQILSAFIGATIPMGIMQSTSTQNDYAVTFWLLGLAYFVLKLEKGPVILNAGAAPETYHCYKKLSIMIRQHKYDKIGLIGIDNEYPLWVMLKRDQRPVRLEHIEVNNVSQAIAREFVPNAVIDFGSATDRGKRLKINYKHQVTIGRDSSGGLITLYGK